MNPYSFLFKITGKERIKRHFERLGIHRNMQIPYERVFLDDYDEERVLVSLVPITLQKEYARLQNTDESESTRSMLIKEL